MSESSNAFKRDWREILRDIELSSDNKSNAPLNKPQEGKPKINGNKPTPIAGLEDPGILGDEAFEAEREEIGMGKK